MTQLGPYQLEEKLGSGGMGTVYRARHVETGETVALKVLRADVADDPVFLRRFQREAEIARSLISLHIVQTLDAGVDDDTPYIAVELVEGESLATYMRRAGPLPVDEAMDIALQVARGLDIAHQHGVIHRDISPQNILLARDGTAKIADFGIARSEAYATLTATSAFVGKPAYTAPEIFQGGQVDIRSDIYSLGVVLFEMLTGRAVFIAPTPMALMEMHVRQSPPNLEQLGVRVPLEVENVLRRCLEKETTVRYQTPRDVISGLSGRDIAYGAPAMGVPDEGETITVRPGGAGRPPGSGEPRAGDFWRWFTVGSATAVLAAAAIALVLVAPWKSNSEGSMVNQPHSATPTSVRTATPSPRRTATPSPVRTVTATPAPTFTLVSGTSLGGISVSGYCISVGFERAVLRRGQVGPGFAFDNWQCVGNGSSEPTDMQQACEWDYGRADVVAQPKDPDDAYTWICVVPQ